MNKLADISVFESLSSTTSSTSVTAFNQRKAVNNKMGRVGKTLGALTLGAATLLPGCGWIHKPGEYYHNHFTKTGREETDYINIIKQCETIDQLRGFEEFVTDPTINSFMPRILPAYVAQFDTITRNIAKQKKSEDNRDVAVTRQKKIKAAKQRLEAAKQFMQSSQGGQTGESTSGKVANRRITNHRTPRRRVFNGFLKKPLPLVLGASALAGGIQHAHNHPEDGVLIDTFLNTPISEHLDEAKWRLQEINPFDNRSVGRVVLDRGQAEIRAAKRAARRDAFINLQLANCLSKVQTDPSDQPSREKLAKLLNYARSKNTKLKPEISNTLKELNVKWP